MGEAPILAGRPRAMTAVTLATLGDLSEKYRLYGVCNTCHTMRLLPMVRLLHDLGVDFPISGVRYRIRCQGCGGRDCGIRIVGWGCERIPA